MLMFQFPEQVSPALLRSRRIKARALSDDLQINDYKVKDKVWKLLKN